MCYAFVMKDEDVKLGEYRHFKGDMVEVIGIAKHSETFEECVVYKHETKEGKLWVRPKEVFLEDVDKPEIGYKGPRFVYIEGNK